MSLEAFAKALTAFQAEIPSIGKDQTAKIKTKQGGDYTYTYTDLSTIVSRALPLLAAQGLSWTARPTLSDRGFVLAYSLLHVDGHREDGEYPLPDPSQHGAQEIGSAITYARRYTLCTVTGIAVGGEDDDGQAAAASRSAQPAPAPKADQVPLGEAKARVWHAAQKIGYDGEALGHDYAACHDGHLIEKASLDELNAYAADLEADKQAAKA